MSSTTDSFPEATPMWKQLAGGASAVVLSFVLVPAAVLVFAGLLPVLPIVLPILAFAAWAPSHAGSAPAVAPPLPRLRALPPRHAHGAA